MDEVGSPIFPNPTPILGANGDKISCTWSKKDYFFTR